MSFSESLTVRILGDSSDLQRELDSVLNRFDDLKSRITESTNSARQFSSSFSRLSQSIGPLQQVSNLIARIGQQLQSISQRPITLNVSSAMQALQQLTQAAQRTAGAIQAIPSVPSVGPASLPLPFPGGGRVPNQPPRRMASGGLVSGRSGIDRVPANLTSGEYVINRSAVEALGLGFLEALNSVPNRVRIDERESIGSRPSRVAGLGSPPAFSSLPSLQGSLTKPTRSDGQFQRPVKSRVETRDLSQNTLTNNHFGGITIEVSEAADSESLLRNLELQGIGRRIRQG
ncbi:hypothetical protein [Thalassoglobus polymorphus]|uniref:Uncharacterized protein n=1 Tax=Thalassoglobus polymorphus TaxID=2527994 RepID=A0A517QPR3_9PLAN|nr:hypothetical protein [Thalassoglobus polymorphus]QDT33630.1 hypothetical protein Mal48_28840 [Thalassoglobus polymorphus]